MNQQKGTIIKGHYCYDCLKEVDEPEKTSKNQPKTEFCERCGHRREGLNSSGLVGDWLIIGKTK